MSNYADYAERVMVQALEQRGQAKWVGAKTMCWRPDKDPTQHVHLTLEARSYEFEHEPEEVYTP